MPRKRESRLQRAIRRDLERRVGGVWVKIHGSEFQEPGIADLLGCVQGLHIEVEVKTDGGRSRKTQLLRQWRITRAGGIYVFVRSSDEAIKACTRWLRRHGKTAEDRSETIPGQDRQQNSRPKTRRIVRSAKDGEDFHLPARRRKVVAKRISP